MFTLGNLTLFLACAALGAWLWHSHGIRERALAAVRRHCDKASVVLLDDHVAFRRLGLVADGQGRRRLARVYDFEFTVTGEQRHNGSITMYGPRVGRIELAPHPMLSDPASPAPAPVSIVEPPLRKGGQVVSLADWRSRHRPSPPRQ